MAFIRPTMQELVTRIQGDFKGGLGLVTILRRSFLGVIAIALAGLAHSLFGYLKFIEKQAFPDTATDEYLDRWAGIWNVTRKVATFNEFVCAVEGTAGTVIPNNRTYKRADGKEYLTTEEITLTGSGDEISMIAVEAGTESEVEAGDTISILSPIAGLVSEAEVSEVVTEPDDAESDESLRERLIDRIQNPPSGGAANDYIQWAKEVAGITRAWVAPLALGPGTVTVYVVSDDEDPITPSSPKITEVEDHIEEVRPATANVTVVAPVLFPIDLTIQLGPNTASVRAAVEAELDDLILRDAQVVDSWASPTEVYDGKILLSRINEAISIAAGEDNHIITEINGDSTPGDVEPPTGNLAVLGDITWQNIP